MPRPRAPLGGLVCIPEEPSCLGDRGLCSPGINKLPFVAPLTLTRLVRRDAFKLWLRLAASLPVAAAGSVGRGGWWGTRGPCPPHPSPTVSHRETATLRRDGFQQRRMDCTVAATWTPGLLPHLHNQMAGGLGLCLQDASSSPSSSR